VYFHFLFVLFIIYIDIEISIHYLLLCFVLVYLFYLKNKNKNKTKKKGETQANENFKLAPSFKSLDQELDQCSEKQPPEDARKNVNLDSILWYIFTSGTTGLPKAAKVTNK